MSDATTATPPTHYEFDFDTDTRVHKRGAGHHTATITDRWTVASGSPNGGYLLALTLAAMRDRVAWPDPLVVSAFFLRPGRVGPAGLTTEVVRQGRRMATTQARLLQGDTEILRATATFGDVAADGGATRRSFAPPPDLPAPADCVDVLAGHALPGVTVADRVAYRAPRRPGWVEGAPGGDPTLQFWMRLSDGRAVDVDALAFLVDAGPPAVLELGHSNSATMELTLHVRARPAAGWLACRAATRHVAGGYHEEDFEIWDSTGVLVAQSRQLAVLA